MSINVHVLHQMSISNVNLTFDEALNWQVAQLCPRATTPQRQIKLMAGQVMSGLLLIVLCRPCIGIDLGPMHPIQQSILEQSKRLDYELFFLECLSVPPSQASYAASTYYVRYGELDPSHDG